MKGKQEREKTEKGVDWTTVSQVAGCSWKTQAKPAKSFTAREFAARFAIHITNARNTLVELVRAGKLARAPYDRGFVYWLIEDQKDGKK